MGYRHQFTGRTEGIRATAPLRWRGLDGLLGAYWQAEGERGGRGYYLSANPRISVFFEDVSSVRVGDSEGALARRGRPMARAFYVPAGAPMAERQGAQLEAVAQIHLLLMYLHHLDRLHLHLHKL